MIAVIFPGQGSQSSGMLADFAARVPHFLQRFETASDILGYDLWALIQNGPEEKLNQTEFTQPAILVASIAIWDLVQSYLPKPHLFAGHSLGEYTALVCANALGFAEAVKLVQQRGQLMQEASAPGVGGMAAIVGLADEITLQICQEASTATASVNVANFNSIGQTVIAGNIEAVEKALLLAKAHKAKIAKLIPVSVPAHSRLMQPAAEKFALALKNVEICRPALPVLHNVNAESCNDPEKIRELLVAQLYSPVRWTAIQQKIAALGVTQMYEVGPGKVLCGLAKRTIPEVSCAAIHSGETYESLRGASSHA